MIPAFRKMLLFSGSAVLLATSVTGIAAAAPVSHSAKPPVSIVLDGFPLPFPAAPYVTQGTTMVPFRAIAEALSITVEWSNASQTLTATKTSDDTVTTVVLHKNDKQAKVNGEKKQLTVAPLMKSGSVFVPLSFFSTQFGAAVGWDGSSQTVSIASPKTRMYTEAFYATSSFSEVGSVNRFNAVSFGWTRIDADGKLVLNGKDFFWPKAAGDITPESIVQGAIDAGGKPSLMAVAMDGSRELTKLLADNALQDDFIANLVKLASDNHFSGITLDFEGLGLNGDLPAIRQSFTALVKKLDASAEAANLKLALALHPLNSSYRGYDYKALSAYADEIILMAYDYSYEEGPEPLNRVNEAIQLALKEVPKSKLVLGINTWNETSLTIGGKIGLAKRYALKGVAFWRLGLIGSKTMGAIENTIFLQ